MQLQYFVTGIRYNEQGTAEANIPLIEALEFFTSQRNTMVHVRYLYLACIMLHWPAALLPWQQWNPRSAKYTKLTHGDICNILSTNSTSG